MLTKVLTKKVFTIMEVGLYFTYFLRTQTYLSEFITKISAMPSKRRVKITEKNRSHTINIAENNHQQ